MFQNLFFCFDMLGSSHYAYILFYLFIHDWIYSSELEFQIGSYSRVHLFYDGIGQIIMCYYLLKQGPVDHSAPAAAAPAPAQPAV